MSFIVAIDGTAGTGKSTLAKMIAKDFDFMFLDTGAMYRAVAVKALENNIDLEDEEALGKMLENTTIMFENAEDGTQKVFLDAKEVTTQIRGTKAGNNASKVSGNKVVRYKMVELQRKMAKGSNVILEGRDTTTLVFPNANVKIYLDGAEDERALRRYKEFVAKGIDITLEQVKEDMLKRDKYDKEKEVGALKIADDAHVIDTTGMTIECQREVLENIIKEEFDKYEK